MASEPLIRRAQVRSSMMAVSRVDRVLGHPAAFLFTTVVLILIFGWTFFANPGRPAAADDPAYYQWRTEALLANEPEVLLEVDGPRDMYSGGYRVATSVLAGLMRRIAGVAPLTPTVIIGVGLRVAIPLLLAGFAYRWRRDPLIWHAVAFTVASLLPTPPFAGYLDNVLTLAFLSAALYLIEPARSSWGPRVGFAALLLVSGFTHPTTLAIFCLTLGAMATARFLFRGFSFRDVLRKDGPILLAAIAAIVLTYLTWKIGIWGESSSLGESAQPPPASADFFRARLAQWGRALAVPLNGPLFVIGLIGLIAAGARVIEEEMPRVSIIWLAPLLGLGGAALGLTYPYYRFLNTTTAWLLLVALGAYFLVRFCFDIASRGHIAIVALIGVLAIGALVGMNFKRGFEETGWNDVSDAWIKPDERTSLEPLASVLAQGNFDSVVFVVDDDTPEPVRVYGFAKRAGNVSRYGVPDALQDATAFYLGSLENYQEGRPTARDNYYEGLSADSLRDARETATGRIAVVVADVFNRTGSNVDVIAEPPREGSVLVLRDGEIFRQGSVPGRGSNAIPAQVAPRALDFLPALLGGLLLLLPGVFLLRWALPDATWTDALGLVAVFSTTALVLVGIGTLGITGTALAGTTAWVVLAICGIVGLVLFLWSGFRGEEVIARKDPAFSEL
ncbi:MAG: hypothetical protein M3277_12950 [Actinomycetota bacterium]|nr:hypothetical protein [Actinomycetota bacterium]